MEEKAAEPAIRFAEFAGAWEQRKLGDVLEFLKDGTHGTHPDADQGPLLLSAKNIKNGDVTWDDTDRKISQAEFDMIHSNFKLKKGDVLLTIVGSIGESAILKDPHEITFQRSVAFLRPNKTITSGFLYSEIQGEKFQTELNNRKSTSAQPGIYLGDLSEIPLDTPPNLKEQEEIGKFFSEINSLLTLHQRKYEKLLNIKKSMLEKMFPKEGEVVPEIRFKGFTGAWEERKLGDIADITGGGTPSTSNNDYWDGIINWYSPAEISNQIFLNSSQRKITELGYSSCSAKMLPRGTVLFTSRAGIGKTAILSAEGCTNQGFQSIVPHANELDSYFIFSRTHELKKYGEVVGAGSTFVEVSGKQMAAMTLMMPPKFNEQKMIGDFFKRLDSILTLHQRKLEMLKNIKQAFLDKMFV